MRYNKPTVLFLINFLDSYLKAWFLVILILSRLMKFSKDDMGCYKLKLKAIFQAIIDLWYLPNINFVPVTTVGGVL